MARQRLRRKRLGGRMGRQQGSSWDGWEKIDGRTCDSYNNCPVGGRCRSGFCWAYKTVSVNGFPERYYEPPSLYTPGTKYRKWGQKWGRLGNPGTYQQGGRANNNRFSGRTQTNPKGKPKK